MTGPKAGIEAFIRAIVAEIVAAEAQGITTQAALAEHLNARGITTRKGRRWNATTVGKFLSSPGARRFRAELTRRR